MRKNVQWAGLTLVLVLLALPIPAQAGAAAPAAEEPTAAREAPASEAAGDLAALEPECLRSQTPSPLPAPWEELARPGIETLQTESLASGWDCRVNQCLCRLDDCEGGACLCAFTTGCSQLEIELCCECACFPCASP